MRQLAGSLHVAMKKIDDDAEISLNQVVFWATFFLNKYKTLKADNLDSGTYLSIYTDVSVGTFATSSNPSEVAGRKYVQLPSSILDLDGDRGIAYMSYVDKDGVCGPSFANVKFSRTTPMKAKRIYGSDYERPSPSNPYFYRVGDYLYLLGVECIALGNIELGLYTTFDPFTDCELDTDLGVGEDVIADIYRNVLELGRFVMLIPSDNINEGEDTQSPEAAPKQRVVSVNQEAQIPQIGE